METEPEAVCRRPEGGDRSLASGLGPAEIMGLAISGGQDACNPGVGGSGRPRSNINERYY